MFANATIGSVSSGTLRPEHLIPAFIDTLEKLTTRLYLSADSSVVLSAAEKAKIMVEVRRLNRLLGDVGQRIRAANYYESQESDYDLRELFDELQAFAPPFCFFGAHPNDGTNFGFWVCNAEIWLAEKDGTLIKAEADGERLELGPEVEYVLEGTEHEGYALYARNGDEVWSMMQDETEELF